MARSGWVPRKKWWGNKRRAEYKRFDCLEFKRRAQSKVYEDTCEMTVAKEAEYFRRRAKAGTLGSWWKRVKTKDTKQGKAPTP